MVHVKNILHKTLSNYKQSQLSLSLLKMEIPDGNSPLGQLYSMDISLQETQNLVTEKCSHLCICYLYRVFSLTWPTSMQIYWNKRKRLHKKRVQLPEDWFGTPTWPPFHCFGTPIWPPWRHVKTLYWRDTSIQGKGTLFLGPKTQV